jgi:hypothetical protein
MLANVVQVEAYKVLFWLSGVVIRHFVFSS